MLSFGTLPKNPSKHREVVTRSEANDGTLLKYFKKSGFKTIGCEPAKNLTKELKKNCHYVMDDFWSFEKLDYILNKHNLKKPKLITAIGMFYDLDDPRNLLEILIKH